jgi:hypothetical protein
MWSSAIIRGMPDRRRQFPHLKSLELERQIERLELLLTDVRNTLDVLMRRTASVQAQLDHVADRISRV